MLESFVIPAPVFRAYKPLIMGKGKAEPSNRIAEFVRLGVTAYDFTLTYSDHIILIHTSWPKPRDMGNACEGWFSYLNKDEFAAFVLCEPFPNHCRKIIQKSGVRCVRHDD